MSPWVATTRLSLVATDRKSTRLNSSHLVISYAVFCLKKKTFSATLSPFLILILIFILLLMLPLLLLRFCCCSCYFGCSRFCCCCFSCCTCCCCSFRS